MHGLQILASWDKKTKSQKHYPKIKQYIKICPDLEL